MNDQMFAFGGLFRRWIPELCRRCQACRHSDQAGNNRYRDVIAGVAAAVPPGHPQLAPKYDGSGRCSQGDPRTGVGSPTNDATGPTHRSVFNARTAIETSYSRSGTNIEAWNLSSVRVYILSNEIRIIWRACATGVDLRPDARVRTKLYHRGIY